MKTLFRPCSNSTKTTLHPTRQAGEWTARGSDIAGRAGEQAAGGAQPAGGWPVGGPEGRPGERF